MRVQDGSAVEAELLKQQDILAKFGELALKSNDLSEILTEACRLVGEALGTDLAKVMELQEDGITLLVRAGVGWKPGVVGEVTVKAVKGSSEGHALQTGHPVCSNDIELETRFEYADFIKDNGVRALVNVAIGGSKRPYGVLQVDSQTPRDFGNRETSFLRSYANLLAAAVERLQGAAALRVSQAALKAHEAALTHSNKLEAIGQLTGGVAHDFNNLLTIIRSAADFLRRTDLPEDRRVRYVEAISETVDRASKLTGQLLAFARQQTLMPEAFDVGQQVQKVIELLSPLLGSLITIEKILCDPPCYTRADISQFDTALINLALNARDAMNGEGYLNFEIEHVSSIPAIRSHPLIDGDFISISVADTGSGINKEQVSRIFEPFFTTKEQGKGTGLGLSQVFGFAKQSHGQVDVRSILGQGSVFTIYLPHVAALDPSKATEPLEANGPNGKGACILLVEDNQAVGQYATEMLHDLGYRVAHVANARKALEQLSNNEHQFQLVFSDVVMPGMNGIQLAEEIHRTHPDIPVVLTSGYSSTLAEEGSHGFKLIQKPYSVDALSRVLRDAIGGRGPYKKTPEISN
jgi:signal transduction histidine kinase/CheY-like chemotaxis protein